MIERLAALEAENIQLRQQAAVFLSRYERSERKLQAIVEILILEDFDAAN